MAAFRTSAGRRCQQLRTWKALSITRISGAPAVRQADVATTSREGTNGGVGSDWSDAEVGIASQALDLRRALDNVVLDGFSSTARCLSIAAFGGGQFTARLGVEGQRALGRPAVARSRAAPGV